MFDYSIEERFNELTNRVNELTSFLSSMYHTHPELCPHKWEQIEIKTFNNGNQIISYHCPLCGRNKEERYEIL